jgi:TolB protein
MAQARARMKKNFHLPGGKFCIPARARSMLAMVLSKHKFFSQGLRTAVWLALLLVAPIPAPAATAAAGDGALEVHYDPTARQIGISVVSSSPDLQKVMSRAFAIHGAFNPSVTADHVEYTLRFTPTASGHVTVSAEARNPAASFQADATGENTIEAAYRAGDIVVQKLTQRPGFFAGKLAFVSQRTRYREIWTSDILGQAPFLTQLTQDHSISANPRWAPDGTKLLYTGYYRSGFPDIILYNLATHARSVFAGYQGTNTGGVFSPDGRSVAMILSSKEGSTELFVADAEGKNIRRLTHATSSKSSPTWSPDGARIILSCDPQGYPLLYQIPAAGGNLQLVQNKVYAYSAEAAWNPVDANVIAFMQQMANGTMQVLTFDFKSGAVKVLADGFEPCWANDGRHIFYTKHVKGVDQLFVVDSLTKKDSQLTTLGASDPAFVYVK